MGRWSAAIDPAWLHHEQRPTGARLALQWLGTAGFRVVFGEGGAEHHVWLDPHLSRHSLAEAAFSRLQPNLGRIEADVDRADAVAVGHAHFDHAMDAPEIARGYGTPDALLRPLQPGVTVQDGPCGLTAYRSQHSRFALGRVPAPGHVTAPLRWPARALDFRVGDVLALHLAGGPLTIAHLGSADLIEAELEGVQADVVLACTIGRHATPNFTRRMIDALRPQLVVPCHWDRFWRPIDAPPLQIPTNDLEGFLGEVRSHPRAPAVKVLPLRGWLTLA